MSSSSVAITIRSTTFLSSRTLFRAPLVGHQEVERVGRDALLPNAEAGADAGQKLVHKRRDVGEPVAERRHPDQVHVEPIEQVLPKAPGADLRLELAVGRRHDPRLDPDRFGCRRAG